MNQISLDEIQMLIQQGETVRVRDYIKSMSAAKDSANLDHLVSILLSVDEKSVRNAAAIAVSDLGGSLAIAPIVELVRNDKTKNARGTLLYALTELDVSLYLELLLDVVLEENFEGSHQAFALIRDSTGPSDLASFDAFQEKLDEGVERLQDKIRLLKELKKTSKRWHVKIGKK